MQILKQLVLDKFAKTTLELQSYLFGTFLVFCILRPVADNGHDKPSVLRHPFAAWQNHHSATFLPVAPRRLPIARWETYALRPMLAGEHPGFRPRAGVVL